MENLSEQFVNKVYTMSRLEFPAHVKEKAKECLIDYLAVVVGGSKYNSTKNKQFIKDNKLEGMCHIFGESVTTDLRTAVMINAFNAHILELDDSHRVAMTHLGAPIFSALIGVAEVYDKSIDEVLNAAVVGYEVAVRLANTIQPSHKKRGFHVSGTCCTMGCAMGIAALLEYSSKEMENVFSAAVTSAAGLLAVISGASQQKPYNIANAAVAGVNAALYGKYFTGAVDILDDSRGFFHAESDEVFKDRLFEKGYAIETIYQKLYAACRHCHAPMEAMLGINCKMNDIERIDVKVYDLAIKGHDHTEIAGISSAKQSIPYGVAVACVYKECGIKAFTEEAVRDEKVLKLAKRVRVIEDVALTAMVPEKRAARVEIHFIDGKMVERQVDYPKGEPENPITNAELEKKFYELTLSGGMLYKDASELYTHIQQYSSETVRELFETCKK